jgi:hypothetical protein
VREDVAKTVRLEELRVRVETTGVTAQHGGVTRLVVEVRGIAGERRGGADGEFAVSSQFEVRESWAIKFAGVPASSGDSPWSLVPNEVASGEMLDPRADR